MRSRSSADMGTSATSPWKNGTATRRFIRSGKARLKFSGWVLLASSQEGRCKRMAAVEDSQLETVREFLKDTSRGVLMTRRRDGGIQSSPMALADDDDGNVLISTRYTAHNT